MPTSSEAASSNSEEESRTQELINKSETLTKGYYYDEALELLKADADNPKISQRIAEVEKLKSELVEYTGTVHHIFFHSLIIYPQLAFDDVGHPKDGYNSTMSTRDEFLKLLPQIYERGYVLYNINDVFVKNSSGAMVQNKIYLPKGKKPLILSQDDVSYYEYMKPDGFATRLVIDSKGEIATEVKDLEGNVSITRDGDLIPIIDDFLKTHPDFSYRGAKGIIALTGYEGVLGYRLETEESKAEAKAVAEKLKESGWLFASHSFTHNRTNYWGPGSAVNKIQYDTKRWNTVVKPIVGSSNIFIAPFGYVLPAACMKVITDDGYNIYCSVVAKAKIDTSNPKIAIQGRYEIAGYNMINNPKYITENFFDAESVVDKTRPKL
ncbi:MAG: hypothetical protein LBS74_09220 [Oscillospiraceae bacterium]|nr:hypothetical protein [Oscillospiraceae bacterium]